MKLFAILTGALLPLAGQAAEPMKTFEVATVKPAVASSGGDFHDFHSTAGPRLGPGTADATRWACDSCSLATLLMEAYQLKRFQISGPRSLDSERFDIVARVAEGATKEDLRAMQRNLLAERFGLKAHLEKKEMQVYDLVAGKAPRLKEAAPPKPDSVVPQTHEFGHGAPGGFADHSAGRTVSFSIHGITRHQAVGEDMGQLADWLAAQLDRPVTDSTGLRGKYDFLLTFSGGKEAENGNMPFSSTMHGGPGAGHAESVDPDALPPLLKAIQDQLGLRLEAKKGMADILIVDHVEKLRSDN